MPGKTPSIAAQFRDEKNEDHGGKYGFNGSY